MIRNENYVSIIKKQALDFEEIIYNLDLDRSKIIFNLKKDVIDLLEIEKPKIMFCGVYNAGKSTLVNALMGEEVAKMADRPETSVITEYEKENYIIVDSPGVNAPIEHEIITHDYIKRCHIVFFVISNKGTFEDKKNYDEMLKIINMDKELIIILNNKSGEYDEENHPEIILMKKKLLENLKKYSKNDKIDKNYSIIFLNAKRALRGVLENNKTFYEKSNINVLNSNIKRILQNVDAFKMLKTPINNFKNIIDYCEKQISSKNDINDVEYYNKIEILNKRRDAIIEDMRLQIKQVISGFEDEMVSNIMCGNNDYASKIEDTVKTILDNLYNSKLKEISIFVKKNFSNIDITFDSSGNIDFVKLKNKISANEMDENKNFEESYEDDELFENSSNFLNNILDTSLTMLSKADNFIPPTIPPESVPILIGAFKFIKELFTDKSKKEYEKALEKAEIENERQMQRAISISLQRQDVRNKVRTALYDMQSSYSQYAVLNLGKNFDILIEKINQKVIIDKKKAQIINGYFKKFNEIKSILEEIETKSF